MKVQASLLLMLVSLTPAAEIVRRDLQFSLGLTPTDFDYTIKSPGGTFSGSDAFDYGWQTRLGGRWAITSPGWSLAPVIGGDLSYATSYGAGGQMSCLGLGATGGVAWAINERWSSDLELGLGFQRASLSLDSGADLSGTGTLFAMDVRLRVLRQLDRTWSIGVETGWQKSSGTIAASQGRDIDMDIAGWTAGLLIVWRGSMRPAALE
jgi:hypothetical protein